MPAEMNSHAAPSCPAAGAPNLSCQMKLALNSAVVLLAVFVASVSKNFPKVQSNLIFTDTCRNKATG
jgi:hypothetical protein